MRCKKCKGRGVLVGNGYSILNCELCGGTGTIIDEEETKEDLDEETKEGLNDEDLDDTYEVYKPEKKEVKQSLKKKENKKTKKPEKYRGAYKKKKVKK